MTTFRITLRLTLKEIKEAYREHFNIPKSEKVTKYNIAIWLGTLVEADIM